MDWTIFVSVLAAMGFAFVIALTILYRDRTFGVFEIPLRGLLAEYQDWSRQDRIYSENRDDMHMQLSSGLPKGGAEEYNDIDKQRMLAELDLNRVASRLSFIAGEGRDAPIAMHAKLENLKRQLESHPYHELELAERRRELL